MADQQQVALNEEEANRLLLEYSGNGVVEQLQIVLEEGKANVNHAVQDYYDHTGLIFASRNGHVECAKLLLDFKANIEQPDAEGWTALICASQYGHVECAKLLLDFKANTGQEDESGYTPLIHASRCDSVECAKLLLDSKANIEHEDDSGATSLLHAVRLGIVECVKFLLDSMANIHHQDEDGRTALMVASQCGHAECAKLLLESGANVNVANDDELTALSDCCGSSQIRHNKPLLQFVLLSCGAEGEEGKEVLDETKTRITTYHTELKKVLSEEVIVDTRFVSGRTWVVS